MKFQDIIEVKTDKPTKNPKYRKYGFKMAKQTNEDGSALWINTIDAEIAGSIEEGDLVDFEIKENPPYGFDIVSAEKILTPDTPAKTGIEKKKFIQSKPKKKNGWHAYQDEAYQREVNDNIIRQVCLKEARAVFEPLPYKIGDPENLWEKESGDKELETYLNTVDKVTQAFYRILTGKEWPTEEEVPF